VSLRHYAGRGVRLILDCVREPGVDERVRVRSAPDVGRVFRALQRLGRVPLERECVVAIYLDARHRTIGTHVVSVGTASESSVHPREVFRPAIAAGASAVIVAHNHPTGDATPSQHDRGVTDRLLQAGELLGIDVLDHVVVGDDHVFSIVLDMKEPCAP